MNENCIIKNFTALTAYAGGQKFREVRNAAGEETGIEVSGVLTTFDVANENGTKFTRDSYDQFVDRYYMSNRMNIPLVLYHNDSDPRTVAGIVKKLVKTDSGVELVGWIPRSAYYYNLIKSQIAEGILQGFSNSGRVKDGEWDAANHVYVIKDFALLHASLVATPADTGAMLSTENTLFQGFAPQAAPAAEDPIDNEVNEVSAPTEKKSRWELLA